VLAALPCVGWSFHVGQQGYFLNPQRIDYDMHMDNKTVQEGISARSFGISRNFSCSLPTTPRKPEKADNGSIFSLIPSTDRKRILPTAAAIFPFAFSYWGFSKTPNGNEKKQQIR